MLKMEPYASINYPFPFRHRDINKCIKPFLYFSQVFIILLIFAVLRLYIYALMHDCPSTFLHFLNSVLQQQKKKTLKQGST